ncbi:MAG: carbohydrate porin [Piscinibacter sp.]|nr:carbohydrate porin [Piscinibacter sp.]
MRIKPTLIAAAAISLLSTGAYAVDWGGYVRVGPGQKQNSGTEKKCFDGGADGGHGGIGRLGNECNTYGEFALSQGGEAGGVKYKTLLMANFFNEGSDPGGNETKVNQIYVEGQGFDIAPNLTFWVGRRFYHRADVHFDDTFIVDMSGSGAGVDGIDMGVGSLSAAVFRTGDESGDNPGTRLNLDLEGINTNPGGKLRLTGVYTNFSGPGGEDGFGISLQHNQANLFAGGDNTFWAQYATGSAYLNMGFGGGTDDNDKKRWRLTDAMTWVKGPLTGQAMVSFGEEKTGDVKRKYNQIAGRVAYAMTKNFKLQAELGTAAQKPTDGAQTQRVTKFTIAPTLTVGPNYYDRPELRFYVSTFKFNDAYQAAQGQTKSNKTAAGFQAEIWF